MAVSILRHSLSCAWLPLPWQKVKIRGGKREIERKKERKKEREAGTRAKRSTFDSLVSVNIVIGLIVFSLPVLDGRLKRRRRRKKEEVDGKRRTRRQRRRVTKRERKRGGRKPCQMIRGI